MSKMPSKRRFKGRLKRKIRGRRKKSRKNVIYRQRRRLEYV